MTQRDLSAPDTLNHAVDQDGTAPHNIEAEQALLGSLLYENEVFHKVSGWLRAEHFYDPVHARIYEHCSQRINAGKLADAIVIKSFMEADEGLAELGGTVYLADLMREAPEAPSAPEYGKLVYEMALRRMLIALGSEISANARDANEDIDATHLIEQAEQSLFSLAEDGKIGEGVDTFQSALSEWLEMTEAAYKSGRGISGVTTGLTSLDRKLGGLSPSDLIILAGRPSMGKTALALNIAMNAAKAGYSVGFWSLEMSKAQLAGRQLAAETAITTQTMRRGEIGAADFEALKDAERRLSSMPLHIDQTGGITPATLRNRARRLKRTKGLDLIVIDYLQLMRAGSRKIENRVQEVSEITMALKSLAKDLNIPVLALSQLSRAVEQREDKRPQLSDLRESGSIEQDADVVMFAYREAYYHERLEPKPGTEEHLAWDDHMQEIANQAEVIIGKQRHGPIGTVKLSFLPERTLFSDMEEGR